MQKVVLFSEVADLIPHMQAEAIPHIRENQIESFEGFETFDLLVLTGMIFAAAGQRYPKC